MRRVKRKRNQAKRFMQTNYDDQIELGRSCKRDMKQKNALDIKMTYADATD